MAVQPVPPGFHTVTPHLMIQGAGEALAWYHQAFGAQEIIRMPGPDGKGVIHAEMKIGDSIIFLADDFPGGYSKSPKLAGTTTVVITLYVPNVDAFYDQAVAAGAKATMPPMNMFWGDRFGKLQDPFGHECSIATHIEDVPPQEMGKRAQEEMKKMAASGKPGH